jgi:hypothetical protein
LVKRYFCFVLETRSYYAGQAGLELMVPLSQLSECQDFRCAPPFLLMIKDFGTYKSFMYSGGGVKTQERKE